MAITLNYQVPYAAAGQIALQAGQGQYAQAQQEQALREAQLAEQARQFDSRQQLDVQMAQLQDAQQRRSLGAQMGNAAAGREAAFANSQMENERAMMLAQLQQQGYADMRESDEAMKQADIASREKIQLSQEQMRLKQHYRDQELNTAFSSAKDLESQKNTLTPEQYKQARSQWDQRFGEIAGDYPFMAPQQEPQDDPQAYYSGMMGDAYVPGWEKIIEDLDPPNRAKLTVDQINQHRERTAAEAKYKEQNDFTLRIKEQEIAARLVEKDRSLTQEQANQQAKQQMAVEQAAFKFAMSKKPPTDSETVYGPEDRAKFYKEYMDSYNAIYGSAGTPAQNVGSSGASPGPPAQQSSLPKWTGKPVRFTYNGRTMERFGPGPRDVKVVQ